MGKLAAVAIFGSTGTVASLGGAYMLGVFGSSNLDIPVDLNEFKTKNGGDIVASYFPGVSLSEEGETGTTSKPETNFLGSSTSEVRGRLVVNGEKLKCSTEQSGKLTGRIRGLGTFINGSGDKGLLLYASAKASSEDSKLDAEGVIYSLEKEGDKGKIKQNQKSSGSTDKKIEGTSLDSKFPMVSDTFKSDLKVKEYGGFTDSTDSDKLSKLCKWEDSHNNKKEFEQEFKGSGTWKPETGNNKKPFDGSKDSNSGLTTFYETTDPKLVDLVQSFAGKGTGEYFVNESFGVTDSNSA